MRKGNSPILYCIIAVFVFSIQAVAQQTTQPDAAQVTESVIKTNERIESLRGQILEIQIKEDKLQERLGQIDDELKPENLERITVVQGSTHPEELRERRRSQLETEKKSIQDQIAILEQSRTRLELSIATTQPTLPPANDNASPDVEQNTGNSSFKTEDQRIINTEVKTRVGKKPVKRSRGKAIRRRAKKH